MTRPPPAIELPRDPARDEFAYNRFLNMPAEAIVGGARNLISAAPLGAFLYGIDIPVLVVSGQHDDTWTLDEQTLLARTITRAKHVVVPDTVHSPHRENTEYWIKAVSSFLAEADGATNG